MKKLRATLGMMAIMLVTLIVFSCKDTKKSDDQKDDNHMEMNDGTMNYSDDENMQINHQDTQNDKMMERDQKTSKATAILDNYLQLKNALVADDSKVAAEVGEKLAMALETMDISKYNEEQQKELKEIVENAKEHAEHIAKSEMDHQREHFKALSTDMIDMVAITGTPSTLYQQFCPMYDKGSAWLSASNEIRNPYYGSKMLKCGKVQKEFN